MKSKAVEMIEGAEAFARFRKAAKTIVAIPKSALPPRPNREKKKTTKRKA